MRAFTGAFGLPEPRGDPFRAAPRPAATAAPAADRAAPPARDGASLARFFAARGRRVVDAMGVLWTEYRRPFYASLPFQRRVDLDPGALRHALRTRRIPAVRYLSVTQPGCPSGVYTLSPTGYGIGRVHPKRRRRVRRGLDATECRTLDPDELLALGLELNLDTLHRQRRFDPEFADAVGWRRFVAAVRTCPEVSIGGAFTRGRLSAYDVVCRDGDWLHLLHKMSRTADLATDAGVALDFWRLCRAAGDASLRGVETGFAPIVSGDTLHRYKTDLGFELIGCDLAIRFHPALEPILASRWTVGAARLLARLRPRSHGLERVANVLGGAQRSR
ncbi:hypothetical protein [Anaeromyxobacter oryzae]|uniref:BioF2-like acetyltransferase domain-containing protein n=1 Tax=Anaeromyxobacter oryzae TaxID=2918170 RepID=A0ABM7WS38_9BACT|nr:hypothetical protein [Anaeromyxobacter oryzae]BDG02294.1 hypothetical protein AMOR_12900 [Anaeromyxobacter oryzae]